MPTKKARAKAQHKSQQTMPEGVKIKRVKKTKREISTKEKILGGLGVGSTLLGGLGAVSAREPQSQFVRTTETGQNSTSKVKSALNNVFKVNQARAAESGSDVADDDAVEVLSEGTGGGQVVVTNPAGPDTDEVEVLTETGQINNNLNNNNDDDSVEVLNEGNESGALVTSGPDDDSVEVLNEGVTELGGNNTTGSQTGGSTGNTGGTGSTGGTGNTGNQQTIDSLNAQINTLQGRINSLTSQLQAGSNNESYIQEINSLRAQVYSLQQQLQQARSGSAITVFQNNSSGGLSQNNYQQSGQDTGLSTTYTVKKGDTLWSISKKFYGDGKQWRDILEANLNQIKNPNVLRVGMVLVIPGVSGSSVQTFGNEGGGGSYSSRAFTGIPASGTYTIQRGDTLWDLSQQFYGNPHYWSNLQQFNSPLVDQTRALRVGTVINVPEASVLGTAGWPLPAGARNTNVQTFERQESSEVGNGGSVSSAGGGSLTGGQTGAFGGNYSNGVGVNGNSSNNNDYNYNNNVNTGGGLNSQTQDQTNSSTGNGAQTGGNTTTGGNDTQSQGGIIYKPSGSDVADDDAAGGGERFTE